MSSLPIVPILCAVLASAAMAQSESSASCPAGSEDVRIAALSGLAQLDADQVMPVMRKILERRDVCSISLRRQVIGMVGRSRFGDQTDLLLTVARTDPSNDVRRYAVQALAQSNERGAAALDSVLFSSGDAELRDAALRALANQSGPAARASVRRAAELTTLPLDLRVRAVRYMSAGRRTPDETAYLIAYYNKADHPDLRDAVLRTIAEQRSPEATSWLLGIARDKTKDIEVRRQALSAVGQSVRSNDGSGAAGIDLNGVIGLYDAFAGQMEMQDRALDVIAQRPETAATDKLLQIARTETNPELRRKAIVRVGQRRDPRVRDFLLEVLSR